METLVQSPVNFTNGAVQEIKRLINEPGFDHSKVLRIGVKGGGCSGLSYLLGFDDQKENDQQYESEGIVYVMEKAHEIYLSGIQIDWENGLNNRGFTFNNPNASATCGCGTSFAV
jgi:iron-sulfur cluster assembly accessory protein